MTERSSRVHLVDVLRLVALLQMVNGHTLDAVLLPEVREASWFGTYNFARGLVSVAFMLASGVAFHLTRIRRLPTEGPLVEDAASRRARVRRMIELIVIGYLLRFPLGAFSGDPATIERSIAYFFRVDVLQCIGVSLLVLEGLSRFLVRPGRVRAAALGLAVVSVALAPLGESLGGALPAPIAAWLGHGGGSPFPILPWSAYVLLGAVVGGLVWPEAGLTPPRRVTVGLAGATVGAALLSFALWRSPISVWSDGSSYASMPAFFVEKLAWVLGLLAVAAPLVASVRRLPAPLEALAGRTLAIYVFHLVVLFFPPVRLGARIGPTLALAPALGVSTSIVLASGAFGLAWHGWRSAHARPRAAVVRSASPVLTP